MIPFWIIGVFIILGGLVTFQWGGFYLLVGLLMVAGGAVTIILYVIFAPKYPVTAFIFQKRKGSMRIIKDKVSRRETARGEGTYKYKFKKQKDETRAAFYDNLYPMGAGEIALFYSPAPGEYYQAVFNENMKTGKKVMEWKDNLGIAHKQEVDVAQASIEPVPDNVLEWMVNKMTRQKQKYMQTSAWEKYYPLIIVTVLAVVIIIVVSSLFNSMKPILEGQEKVANSFVSASNTIAAALERIAEAEQGSQTIQGGGIPPPPDL